MRELAGTPKNLKRSPSMLEHNPPEYTHVMLGGRIVETGGIDLANELHTRGYDRIRQAHPQAAQENQEMATQAV